MNTHAKQTVARLATASQKAHSAWRSTYRSFQLGHASKEELIVAETTYKILARQYQQARKWAGLVYVEPK